MGETSLEITKKIQITLYSYRQEKLPYIQATIDYVKYLTQDNKNQSIKGRTISTDRLYTSTESPNLLLDGDIVTVGA